MTKEDILKALSLVVNELLEKTKICQEILDILPMKLSYMYAMAPDDEIIKEEGRVEGYNTCLEEIQKILKDA